MAKKKPKITGEMLNVLGDRGEKIASLALTDFSAFPKPLFQPAFLGDKWPTSDIYAELKPVKKLVPVVLFQVKTSHAGPKSGARSISISLGKTDVARLNRLPLPAYVLAVSEKSKKVYVRLIDKNRKKGVSRVDLANELTPTNLEHLHREIAVWWSDRSSFNSKFL